PPRRAPVPDRAPVLGALAEARRRGAGGGDGAPRARRDRPGAEAPAPLDPLLPARHPGARHARADVAVGVHVRHPAGARARQRLRLPRLEPRPARRAAARSGVPRAAPRGRPVARRPLPAGPRAGGALPARRGAHRARRVGDDVARAPLPGRRAVDRRGGRRNARDSGRAARQARRAQALPRALEGADGAHQPGEGERLTGLDAAAAWSGATYERIAESFAPIHAELVEALRVQPGERFLDVATGTGGVALPAARAGAEVTGQDISTDQLGKARRAAEEAGLSIRFDEGDAQELPYEDESFDVVASAFGAIFAPDRERTARELQRVLRR